LGSWVFSGNPKQRFAVFSITSRVPVAKKHFSPEVGMGFFGPGSFETTMNKNEDDGTSHMDWVRLEKTLFSKYAPFVPEDSRMPVGMECRSLTVAVQ
jgi:hypothetical protein